MAQRIAGVQPVLTPCAAARQAAKVGAAQRGPEAPLLLPRHRLIRPELHAACIYTCMLRHPCADDIFHLSESYKGQIIRMTSKAFMTEYACTMASATASFSSACEV